MSFSLLRLCEGTSHQTGGVEDEANLVRVSEASLKSKTEFLKLLTPVPFRPVTFLVLVGRFLWHWGRCVHVEHGGVDAVIFVRDGGLHLGGSSGCGVVGCYGWAGGTGGKLQVFAAKGPCSHPACTWLRGMSNSILIRCRITTVTTRRL